MHRNAKGHTREEIVKQVLKSEDSVKKYLSYIPVRNAVRKLQAWKSQGAEILYFSSHRNREDVEKDRVVLKKNGFPKGPIFYCKEDEEHKTIAERVNPDMMIEDDCESIGGESEMISPKLDPRLGIKSIVVREFGGIDHLPDKISELAELGKPYRKLA